MFSVFLRIAGVVVGLFVLYILVMGLWTLVTGLRGREPEGVDVEVSAKSVARLGEEFEIEVRVRDRLGRDRQLTSVDFSSTYLGLMKVVSIDLPLSDVRGKPTLGIYVHRMDHVIPADGEFVVKMRCSPQEVGIASGEVTVYVDSGSFRWIKRPLHMVVMP